MGKACSTYGMDEKCIQNLGRKAEDKRTLEVCMRSWEDIRMSLKVYRPNSSESRIRTSGRPF